MTDLHLANANEIELAAISAGSTFLTRSRSNNNTTNSNNNIESEYDIQASDSKSPSAFNSVNGSPRFNVDPILEAQIEDLPYHHHHQNQSGDNDQVYQRRSTSSKPSIHNNNNNNDEDPNRQVTMMNDNENENNHGEHDMISILPPVDKGIKAWLFLAGATYMEIIIWGLPYSIGILHVYWTNTMFKGKGGDSIITLAATLHTGLLYISSAFFGVLFATYPRWTMRIQIAGLITGCVSLIASAFVTQPWHLIVTIGVFYSGFYAAYLPCATLLFEWFHSRRGMASGIMYAGSGVGGTIFPFLVQSLLNKFGYKASMISLGLGYLITGGISLIPIKRRIPLSRIDQQGTISRVKPKVDWNFLKRKYLWLAVATVGITSLGNFIPSLWLPSYADDLGLKNPNGTALVALLNAASAFGNGLIGYMSDRMSLRSTILISCVGSAASCAFLWGFGTNTGVLVAFAIIFGLLGPSFSSVWSHMIHLVAKDDPAVTALTFSIISVFRGVGNLSSGPVSQSLLQYGVLKGATGGYGVNNYGILLIYTAVTIFLGGMFGLLY
ncbi:uncharacterized protein L201_000503 [Kwoniella dendrophila CBS 6074]|uniref:Monocarboxylic acid transporter n=1 Tax=Kwoniella dendrophila CBS 6074 TaxID=1295534 RepID=A0AAX4JJQ5_9TREE